MCGAGDGDLHNRGLGCANGSVVTDSRTRVYTLSRLG